MTTPYSQQENAVAGLLHGKALVVDAFLAAEDIEFGRPIFSYPGEKNAYGYYNDMSKLVFDGDFVTANTIDITVNSVAASTVTFTTDHDTTAGLVVDAVAALTGVECVLDTDDATNRTFLIRTKGATAVVTEDVLLGAGQVSGTITYTSAQVYVGLSLRTLKLYSENAKYLATKEVNVLERGKCYCETNVAVKENLPAYVDIAGVDIGKINITGTAINAVVRSTVTAAGIAILETNGQTVFTYANRF
jgi:hypothetical protein